MSHPSPLWALGVVRANSAADMIPLRTVLISSGHAGASGGSPELAPGSGSPSAIALAAQPRLEEGGEGAIDELDDSADAIDALDGRASRGGRVPRACLPGRAATPGSGW